jgi:Holliday junction DNA helicase RuvA
VSGVGPKIALALIAVLEPDELRRALASGDYATLTRAPGIGRKGAERLVLELRDKVGIVATASGPSTGPMAQAAWRPKLSEALVGLGFTVKQADDAITTLAGDTEDPAVADGDVGLLLRRALGLLGRHR